MWDNVSGGTVLNWVTGTNEVPEYAEKVFERWPTAGSSYYTWLKEDDDIISFDFQVLAVEHGTVVINVVIPEPFGDLANPEDRVQYIMFEGWTEKIKSVLEDINKSDGFKEAGYSASPVYVGEEFGCAGPMRWPWVKRNLEQRFEDLVVVSKDLRWDS